MLDYLYRIKKKKTGQAFYGFFFSINKQHLFSYAVSNRKKILFLCRTPRPLTRL